MNACDIPRFIAENKTIAGAHPKPCIHKNEFRQNRLVSGGIARSPGGRLWATFLQCGETKYSHGVVIYSDDDGKSWCQDGFSNEQPCPSPERTYCTVCSNLWCAPDGRLFWFFDYSLGFFDGQAGVWYAVCQNPDAEHPHWSEAKFIWHGHAVNKPIVGSDQSWYLPISLWLYPTDDLLGEFFPCTVPNQLEDQRGVHIFSTSDQGQSWQQRGFTKVPRENWSFNEPNLFECRDGSFKMYLRTAKGLAESVSFDRCQSWSEPAGSNLRHPPSRIFVQKLHSGRVLMIKHAAPDHQSELKREKLIAILSDDDGKSWYGNFSIDERFGVSYPDGFETPDGKIYVAYDRNRQNGEFLFACFTEKDIRQDNPSSDCRLRQVIKRLPGCENDEIQNQIKILNNQ